MCSKSGLTVELMRHGNHLQVSVEVNIEDCLAYSEKFQRAKSREVSVGCSRGAAFSQTYRRTFFLSFLFYFFVDDLPFLSLILT